MSASPEYQKGYRAGQRKGALDEARMQAAQTDDRQTLYERVYMECFRLVWENQNGWTMDGRDVKNTGDHAELARRMANQAIVHIRRGR